MNGGKARVRLESRHWLGKTLAGTVLGYTLAVALSGVIAWLTPGGLGVTEAGTAAVLVGWGADPAQATAGVVLFSLYTHFFEVPLGVLGWGLWWISPKKIPADAVYDEDEDSVDAAVGAGKLEEHRGPRPERI